MLWEGTTGGGHPHEVGADLFDGEGGVRVSRDGGIHRASELLKDGGNPWLSVLCCDSLPYSEGDFRSIVLLGNNHSGHWGQIRPGKCLDYDPIRSKISRIFMTVLVFKILM